MGGAREIMGERWISGKQRNMNRGLMGTDNGRGLTVRVRSAG